MIQNLQRSTDVLRVESLQRSKKTFVDDPRYYVISDFENQFYISRSVEGANDETIRYYRGKIPTWLKWLKENNIEVFGELRPDTIRKYLIEYGQNHNRGGVHAQFRAIRTFLRWVWYEYDFEFKNPIEKVKCPTGGQEAITGVNPDDVSKLIKAAAAGRNPKRDLALLAILLDTGIRRSSLYNIQKRDVDTLNGSIYIRHSKNHKEFTVYLGKTARKYVRRYFSTLSDIPDDSIIWLTSTGDVMSLQNIQNTIDRITERAGTEKYSLHDFRRYFALESYRNGADVFAVSALLNHSGIEVTKRYLAVNEDDKRAIHNKISPLDND